LGFGSVGIVSGIGSVGMVSGIGFVGIVFGVRFRENSVWDRFRGNSVWDRFRGNSVWAEVCDYTNLGRLVVLTRERLSGKGAFLRERAVVQKEVRLSSCVVLWRPRVISNILV
jgi:hypothetical protein